MVEERRTILNTIDARRGNLIGHLIRHDDFFKTILEGKIEGKRGRGRSRRSYIDQIREKVGVASYQEMAFNRTSAQRKLTFAEIAREARLPENEVELLVMKALAEKLIRGHIDQVSSTVTVSWVRPRALPRSGAAALARRLDAWRLATRAAQDLLTAQPDLLTL
ncbi:26S proteasome non-ATPase regulatory subunit 13-like [Choristoneura fumiferana]|uniref:26S proteasome non-ATPase regulatory subunit 13-like n=1 Tax=Choristoneura fumiferana TaxID=7141 RepID=UPI003D15C52F